jgi:MYXO-CTERM domain-containing protein
VVVGYANEFAFVDPPHVKSPSHPAAVVPEPAGLGLIGLAMLAARRRRE